MSVLLARQHWIKRFDLWLPLLVCVIGSCGLVAIHSAESPPGAVSPYVLKQIFGFILGFIAFGLMARTDYRAVMTSSRTLYLINLFLLAILYIPHIGSTAKGAQRWINLGPLNLQPSEIAKVLVIMTLGAFLERHRDDLDSFPTLLRSLLHVGIPMVLIFRQPDLGTSLALAAVWFAMTFIAGAKGLHLLGIVAGGLALFALAWNVGIIKNYQKDRIDILIHPEKDVQGAGYHVAQARQAIGSGQVFGKGLFKGDMKRLKFVPENHTDFVFTVVAEETGFVGSVVLIGLYLLLILRMLMAVMRSEDSLGQILAAGVVAMYTFHTVENIGMTMGVMPVAGVPLPLFSYGPSSVIASMAALGLVESVYLRRHKISF
jgi:rod shape determining protein RodA